MESPIQLLQSAINSKNQNNLPGIINFCSETKFFCTDVCSFIQSDFYTNPANYHNFLNCIFSLQTKERSSYVNFINSLLSKAETSSVGLTILQSFIPQCPREVLNNNIISWVQHCIRTLVTDGSLSTTSFELLGIFFTFILYLLLNMMFSRYNYYLSFYQYVLIRFYQITVFFFFFETIYFLQSYLQNNLMQLLSNYFVL